TPGPALHPEHRPVHGGTGGRPGPRRPPGRGGGGGNAGTGPPRRGPVLPRTHDAGRHLPSPPPPPQSLRGLSLPRPPRVPPPSGLNPRRVTTGGRTHATAGSRAAGAARVGAGHPANAGRPSEAR